jgi:hypothetical protein
LAPAIAFASALALARALANTALLPTCLPLTRLSKGIAYAGQLIRHLLDRLLRLQLSSGLCQSVANSTSRRCSAFGISRLDRLCHLCQGLGQLLLPALRGTAGHLS